MKPRMSTCSQMSIMDHSGHKELLWSPDQVEDTEIARKTFDELIKRGYSAFGGATDTEAKHALKKFDPTMKEIVMVPTIVGG